MLEVGQYAVLWLTADEVTGMITEKERGVRAAVWSPSGMGKNAGSLLAVLSNTFQVSLFAPGLDPYRTELVEVSAVHQVAPDTRSKTLLSKHEKGCPKTSRKTSLPGAC